MATPKHNIIFLDIDGVLNGYTPFNILIFKLARKVKLGKQFAKRCDPFGIYESRVRILYRICRETDAKIVLSSSWRGAYCDESYHSPRVDKLRRLFDKYNIDVIGRTRSDGNRSKEILDYLEENINDILNFIVIDDETYDLEPFRLYNKVVQTKRKTKFGWLYGLQREDIYSAKSKLYKTYMSDSFSEDELQLYKEFYEKYYDEDRMNY